MSAAATECDAQQARELAAFQVGASVKLRGAPGMGTGRVEDRQWQGLHGFTRLLVRWPGGLSDGETTADLVEWIRASELFIPKKGGR